MKKTISKIIRLTKNLLSFLFKTIFAFSTLAFTGFIFANSYETLFEYDLPYSKAIETTQSYKLIYPNNFTVENLEPNLSGNSIGNYGKPVSINIPNINRRIELIPADIKNEKWLTRPNSAHFAYSLKSDGKIDIFLVYIRNSWRALGPNYQNIGPNNNIFIDTNREWRYMFRIDEVVQNNLDSQYITSEDIAPQLILIIENQKENKVQIIKGTFLTVLTIQQ